ncbi:hypothetical protein A2U01_0054924, partial [Trifolium medium]|nr:hypothetical protein [Trifolium medium]
KATSEQSKRNKLTITATTEMISVEPNPNQRYTSPNEPKGTDPPKHTRCYRSGQGWCGGPPPLLAPPPLNTTW